MTVLEVAFLGSSEITYSKVGAHIIEQLAVMTKEEYQFLKQQETETTCARIRGAPLSPPKEPYLTEELITFAVVYG